MIIEFAGCTGSGKTTFAVGVVDRLRRAGVPVRDYCVRDAARWRTTRNAVTTSSGMFSLLATPGRELSLISRSLSEIRRRTPTAFWRAARAAATIRLTAEHTRRERQLRTTRAAGVVDEGILTLLNLAFGSRQSPSDDEVYALAEHMPLSDMIILVDAPLDTLVDRTVRRNDSPRELRRMALSELSLQLGNAQHAFRALSAVPRVAERMIRIWNPPCSVAARDREIDHTASAVIERIQR